MIKFKVDPVTIFLIIFLIAVIVAFFIFIKTESRQCLKNPYVYGASKMGNVECNCFQSKNKLCPARFFFNESSFVAEVTRCNTEKGEDIKENINYSELKGLITS